MHLYPSSRAHLQKAHRVLQSPKKDKCCWQFSFEETKFFRYSNCFGTWQHIAPSLVPLSSTFFWIKSPAVDRSCHYPQGLRQLKAFPSSLHWHETNHASFCFETVWLLWEAQLGCSKSLTFLWLHCKELVLTLTQPPPRLWSAIRAWWTPTSLLSHSLPVKPSTSDNCNVRSLHKCNEQTFPWPLAWSCSSVPPVLGCQNHKEALQSHVSKCSLVWIKIMDFCWLHECGKPWKTSTTKLQKARPACQWVGLWQLRETLVVRKPKLPSNDTS